MQKLFPILAGVVLSLAFATASHAEPLPSSVRADVRAAASPQADLVVAGADAALRTGLVKTSTATNSRSRAGDAPPAALQAYLPKPLKRRWPKTLPTSTCWPC